MSRPSKFGNPFTLAQAIEGGYVSEDNEQSRAFLVQCFKDWLINSPFSDTEWWTGEESDRRRAAILDGIGELAGKNLACWCSLSKPCHADVLLELANR